METEETTQETTKHNYGLMSILVVLGVLVGVISYDAYKSHYKNDDVEKTLLKINAAKDSTIAARLIDKDSLKRYIDGLKGLDTTIYNTETKIINRYIYENNRIDNAPADSQATILSKNITKAFKRERDGYYDVPRRRGAEGS